MKHLERPEKKRFRVFRIFLVVLAAAGILLTVAFALHMCRTMDSDADAGSQIPAEGSGNVENKEGYLLSTPVADLYIPAIWNDLVKTESTTTEDSFSVTVFSAGDAPVAELYSIAMGQGELPGTKLGWTTTADGNTVNIYVTVHEIEPEDMWDTGETDTVYAIQESVNDVIAQIMALPGFEPAG